MIVYPAGFGYCRPGEKCISYNYNLCAFSYFNIQLPRLDVRCITRNCLVASDATSDKGSSCRWPDVADGNIVHEEDHPLTREKRREGCVGLRLPFVRSVRRLLCLGRKVQLVVEAVGLKSAQSFDPKILPAEESVPCLFFRHSCVVNFFDDNYSEIVECVPWRSKMLVDRDGIISFGVVPVLVDSAVRLLSLKLSNILSSGCTFVTPRYVYCIC